MVPAPACDLTSSPAQRDRVNELAEAKEGIARPRTRGEETSGSASARLEDVSLRRNSAQAIPGPPSSRQDLAVCCLCRRESIVRLVAEWVVGRVSGPGRHIWTPGMPHFESAVSLPCQG